MNNYNVYTQTVDTNGNIVDLPPAEIQRFQLELERESARLKLEHSLSERSKYIEAYRNYQAAVNYGEFERAYGVDEFIGRLRNRDWSALNSIPPQIRYFTGEIGLAESGLTRRM